MARLADIVFDCRHPASLARFWQAVLDDYQIALYDETEMARLASLGVHDVEDDPTVLLEPVAGASGPRIWFQVVPEPKTSKNRVHVDVSAADVPRELDRLIALGARQADEQPPTGVIVLADPEDNEFCLVPQPGP